jgi:predicted metalloprotease
MAIWIVAGNLLATAPAMAQSTGTGTEADVEIVSRMVRDLARAEQRQDYNMLYDLMLPDARRLVPRQAMLNWYESEEALVPTEDPVVSSVTFGEYEYPLTGEVYDNVATVTYTQQGELGGVAQEEELVLHLWHDGQTWRWFFDGTERQVDRIARRTETLLDYHSPYATEAFQQIDEFWAQLFANAGREYVAPVDMVGVRIEPTETGCGTERNISAMLVYYCTLDQTIYYDPEFRDMVMDAGGDYAWYNIIAHEWGHHIQNLLGIDATMDPELDGGFYPIELELQADCMAGMYGQDAFARGLISERDTRAAARVTDAAGDLEGTSWDDPSAHGTGEQREQSFWTGFDDGLRGCNLDLVNPGENENGWHS